VEIELALLQAWNFTVIHWDHTISGRRLLQQAKVLGKKFGSKYEICRNSILSTVIWRLVFIVYIKKINHCICLQETVWKCPKR
jgi:hypothetical protein